MTYCFGLSSDTSTTKCSWKSWVRFSLIQFCNTDSHIRWYNGIIDNQTHYVQYGIKTGLHIFGHVTYLEALVIRYIFRFIISAVYFSSMNHFSLKNGQ